MLSSETLIGVARVLLCLNVDCSHCHETAGYPCRTPSGRYMSSVHVSRRLDATAEVRAALDVALSSAKAARMRARRDSATVSRTQQEGIMAAPCNPVPGITVPCISNS